MVEAFLHARGNGVFVVHGALTYLRKEGIPISRTTGFSSSSAIAVADAYGMHEDVLHDFADKLESNTHNWRWKAPHTPHQEIYGSSVRTMLENGSLIDGRAYTLIASETYPESQHVKAWFASMAMTLDAMKIPIIPFVARKAHIHELKLSSEEEPDLEHLYNVIMGSSTLFPIFSLHYHNAHALLEGQMNKPQAREYLGDSGIVLHIRKGETGVQEDGLFHMHPAENSGTGFFNMLDYTNARNIHELFDRGYRMARTHQAALEDYISGHNT